MTVHSTPGMTMAELRDLPVSVPLVTAGRAMCLGQSASYALYRRGEFPLPVLKAGRRFIVPRAAIFAALGISDSGPS